MLTTLHTKAVDVHRAVASPFTGCCLNYYTCMQDTYVGPDLVRVWLHVVEYVIGSSVSVEMVHELPPKPPDGQVGLLVCPQTGC